MGVYEKIRNNTYKKPQGVYARIHANDKNNTQASVSDNTKKTNDLWVESTAPNVLQKQNINATVKPVNISDFVNQVKNTPKQNLNVEVKPIDIKDYAIPKSELNRIGEEIKAEKERWNNLPVQDKIAEPFKNIGANFTHGDLSIKENLAWNEYRSKQDEATLKKAQEATKAREDFEATNDRIGKGNALTKDFAQYLPQLGGQLKSGLGGAVAGAGAGALGGAGVALAAGQLGPQVALPEEIATVPAGAITGGIWGGRGGYVAGTAKYGYDMMAGNAYKNLLDLGVPNDIALEISNDEAVINSLIEGGGAIVDLISLGIGKLASKGGTTAAKQVAKNKLIAAAKAYGLNVASEGLEEGLQEVVSIGAEKVATEKAGIERKATLEDDINRVKEATKGGLTIAAIGGLGEAGMNYTANTIRNNRAENQKVQAQINQDLKSNKNMFNKDFSELQDTTNVRNVLQNVPKTENLQQANAVSTQATTQNQNAGVKLENVKGLPEISARKLIESQNNKQPNVTLPNQTEMVQNANMEQITQTPNLPTQKAQETLQSAKIAGMTDMDIQKAKELNDMLRSGTRLNFYDEKTIPQNVQADKAKIANGFYKDGTLWINKNSKNKVEQILGHELTHHLETTDSYTDLSNTILDSEVFYDFIAEKGYANVAEYKTKLKEMGYNDAQLDNELVARFVEEKMFTDQKSIDRLARQNTKLVEKIKNWISDLVVSFKGTAQEKELLRIENMYRKALEQARNNSSSNTADIKYYIKKLAEFDETEYNNIQEMQLSPKEYGKLAHIVDTDPSIKPGLNQVETSDATYVIYQKEYNDFKVVDKYEGGVENDATANGNVRGTSETGDGREKLQVAVESIPNQRTAKGNDELLDGNQRARSINVESNNDGINNKKNVAGKEPAFSISENQQETLDRLNKEYDLYMRVREDAYDRRDEVKKQYFEKINSQEYKEAEKYVKGLKDTNEILNSKEYQILVEAERLKNKAREYQEEADMAYADMTRLAEAIEKEEKSHRNTADAIKQAKKIFGTTGDFKEAGYLLQDGSLLDFSGKNQGGPSGRRTIDHREINEVGYDMDEFIDIGNIRLKPESNGFELMHEPTEKQYATLKKYIENANGEIYIDIHKDNKMGRYETKEYSKNTSASKIISDLQYYYKNGSFPYESELQKYRVQFSLPETDNQGRTLSKEQQEFFKDSKVRDENGKLQVLYHGTTNKFSEFNKGTKNGWLGKGIYFTTNKNYAKEQGKNVIEAYINLKKPFISKENSPSGFLSEVKEIYPNVDEYKVAEVLKEKGYDGIIYTHWDKDVGTIINVFEPNQIKNIDNTNPTSNPDIRYSMNPVEVAKNTSNTKALSRYAQTLQSKHQDIPEQINLIQKEVDNGNFTHEVIHDKRSLNYAQKYIEENGFEDAVNHWNELIKRGKPVDKDELALGQTIYNVAVDNKDTKLVMKMASDLVQEYTEIGRNLQSATLLRKMTPDGRLYALERSVQKINQDLMQKFDDFENIQIPEELADELLRSETQKDMDTAVEKIQEYIASKIPATWQEKLNSWRYLAMLGNPRTHIRNIIGNAVFIPAVEMKNALAQVGELAISKDQRTKAFLGKKDAKLLKYAENDFDKNQETIRGENKYDIKSGVQEKRTIYSNGAIEAARKGNFKLLEAEDTLFLKYRYKKAFAAALKARGITIEQLRENTPETVRKVNEIRSYAINEAQKATYRDASIVASMVSRGKRKLLNAANQSTGASKLGYNLAYLGAEGVMPFAKTPINIVKRGIEYSPAGLLNGVKNAIFDVKSGKVTAAQAIDKIAAGATGTSIAALGLWLASMGLVGGGEQDKEKEQALKQLKGYQNYSLNAFGKSYTIDWTAPSSIPLFIGVELYNSINSEDESAFLNALGNIAEPVVEMSMLQGLNDTLTTLGEDSALGNIVGKTLTNYLGQYNPTILGQIARSFDPVRRTTYVDKNIPVPAAAQRFIQQQAAKIPGVSRMLPTYKDQFGQEQLTDGVINRIAQNFFSPGYLKDIKEGAVEQGLTELYEKTGETSVIPSYASKTLTQNGEKINLTAKQYDTYAKTRGDLSKKGLEGLFKDNYYKNLTDEQKVKVVEAIYDYANNIAKTKVLDDFELEFNDKKIQKLQSEGLDFYKYILLKKTADADGNDYTSNDELDKAIKKYGLSRWQKTIKEKNTKSTKTTNTLPTLKQQRAKLPTLKK